MVGVRSWLTTFGARVYYGNLNHHFLTKPQMLWHTGCQADELWNLPNHHLQNSLLQTSVSTRRSPGPPLPVPTPAPLPAPRCAPETSSGYLQRMKNSAVSSRSASVTRPDRVGAIVIFEKFREKEGARVHPKKKESARLPPKKFPTFLECQVLRSRVFHRVSSALFTFFNHSASKRNFWLASFPQAPSSSAPGLFRRPQPLP
jgi:hypothetical protein